PRSAGNSRRPSFAPTQGQKPVHVASREDFPSSIGPADVDAVVPCHLSQSEMGAWITTGEIAERRVDVASPALLADVDRDGGAISVAAPMPRIKGADQQPASLPLGDVQKEPRGAVYFRSDHIQIAVVINVSYCQPARDMRLCNEGVVGSQFRERAA